MRSLGIRHLWPPQPVPQPQPEPQESTGAQQLGSQTGPQPAGAQQLAAAGAQQVGAQAAGAQQLAAAGAQQVGSQAGAHAVGAQQLASTGAQQLGSTLHPQLDLWLNMPNKPACALFVMVNTTIAAESVIPFISSLLLNSIR
jgi:hypothetical protein